MLLSLDTSKANGKDGISARMLKATAAAIAPSVTKLFNLSIQLCRIPHAWKDAIVMPIPKTQGAKTPTEFRPISLLPIISKVLERHFHLLISEHISVHSPLSTCQFGFQSGKSAISALLSVTQDWFKHLEKRQDIGAVFFDFRKAFDSVPHMPLVEKLHKLGLHPYVINWVHNYLADRRQSVVVNGASSRPVRVTSGVPQGSILGPLLFLIYIDDIAHIPISEGSKLVLYADDILLYHPISSPQDYELLQCDVDTIQAYASTQRMTLNTTKCKFMFVSRKKKHSMPNFTISLNGLPLETITTFKYLGVLLSSDLSWSSHVHKICSKARQLLGLIYRRFYRHSNEQTLRQLYISLVLPHLEYASSVWSPHLQKDIALLEKTQHFAVKLCTKQWDSNYYELLDKLQLPTLTHRRLHNDLCLLYKIIHGLMYFPPNVITPSTRVTHTTHPLLLFQPFAHTDAYRHAFVPRSISVWNSLPNCLVSLSSFTTFKRSLSLYTL